MADNGRVALFAHSRASRRRAFLSLAAALLTMLGCQTTDTQQANVTRARFLLESPTFDDYAALVTLPVSQVRIPVQGEAILSEYDYHSIEVEELELGRCLLFQLKPAAARAFYRLTVGNQGKRLVLLIDAQPIGARRIDGPVADGRIHIFLETADENLPRIAAELKRSNIEIQKKLSR